MIFNFDGMFGETYDTIFTVYVGNQPIQSQRVQGPQIMIQQQFLDLVQQIGAQRQPMKVIVAREEDGWDTFEQKPMKLRYEMTFQNFKED